MYQRSNNPRLGSLAITTLLIIIISALIGFVGLSVITSGNFDDGDENDVALRTPRRAEAASETLIGTPDPSSFISFKHTALGFRLEYPRSWLKNEEGLQVLLSPTSAGLDPDNVQDAALWFGIPMNNTAEPSTLLTEIQAGIFPASQTIGRENLTIGEHSWQSIQLVVDDELSRGQTRATLAVTHNNEVGYFMIAQAPAEEWDSIQPAFQRILGSFDFTTEAVLRPTDATPPPTPTPTPTPVIHVIQYGETLSHVAVKYGVTIDALITRNNIDDPRGLQVGAKIIIPVKR